jgi:HK97 gp10 family phage protein
MATTGKFSLKGVEEYLEVLAQTEVDIDAAAKRALKVGSPIISAEMIELVPKDTWNLEEHIGVTEPVQDGNLISVEIGVLDADADTSRYGNAQEYGTKNMPAHSYIRAGFDNKRKSAMDEMKASLQSEGMI